MKVNDYVRTDKGTIFKVENITEIDIDGQWFKSKVKENSVIKDLPRFMYDENDEYIIKSSLNIIDLIAVGDIIKYHPVQNNYVKTNILYKSINNGRELIELEYDITHNKKSIISILTKEQFERCEYKI